MKKFTILIFTLFVFISLNGCNNFSNPNETYCVLSNKVDDVYVCEKIMTSYFDTTSSLKLYYQKTDNYDIEDIFAFFENTLMTYHQYLDRYNEYDGVTNIYTINHTDGPLVIDEILFDAIEYGIEKSDLVTYQDTSLFNIALGPVLDVWHNARNNDECDTTIEFGVTYCPVPNDEITNGVFNTDPSKIQLDRESLTITLTESNMSLDLGGYGKGYVSKAITDYLDTLNLVYLLNLGQSNVVSGGINPTNDTGLFYIALTEPKTEFALQNDYYHIMQMPEGLSLVTSGVNQRYFKGLDDSLVYHHIIDPSTNHPGGYSMSVTVISHDPALADVLSTAVFLLPVDEAISFVNSTSDLEAVWYISKDEIIYSDNFLEFVFQ